MTDMARRRGHPTKGRRTIKVEMTRYDMLVSGELKIEDLDDDEIFRMQLRNVDGHFKGRPPRYIPRELAIAWSVEQQKRAGRWFAEQLPEAQKATLELLRSRHLAPGDGARLRAAELIFDRVLGKVGNETHITVDKGKTFDDVIELALVDTEEEDDE